MTFLTLSETSNESSETRVILNYIGDQLTFPSAALVGLVSSLNPMITQSLMKTPEDEPSVVWILHELSSIFSQDDI